MENGQIIYPRGRNRDRHDYREIATKSSYSVIFVVVALILIRPLMVNQILGRADAYSQVGLYDESKRQCDKALLIDGNNGRAWHCLAQIYKAEGEKDMALAAYLNATQADPMNKPVHFELATLYVKDGLHQQAIPYYERVRRLGPEKPEDLKRDPFQYHKAALDMLALCYEEVGDSAKAEFTLEELRVFYPSYQGAEARLMQLKSRRDK